MAAPPVRYATTEDGFRLAYAAAGSGPQVVVLPFHFNHARLRWSDGFWLDLLAKRSQVTSYDSRGQGLSTRGLTIDPTVADYQCDLEAVIAAAGLESFVMVAYGGFGHVAMRYVAENPDRVQALVLICTSESFAAWPDVSLLPLAESNWDLFLDLHVETFPAGDKAAMRSFFKATSSQPDYIRMVRGFANADAADVLPCLRLPVLFLHSHQQHWLSPEEGARLAARVFGARLVFLEGDAEPNPVQGVRAIMSFLDELGITGEQASPTTGAHASRVLSARQSQVLRLLAAGKTNREIAELLVLSPRTVERHVADLYARIDVRNRAEATAFAMGSGLGVSTQPANPGFE
jgi:DNA-binding NarL/FixJ family response regulator